MTTIRPEKVETVGALSALEPKIAGKSQELDLEKQRATEAGPQALKLGGFPQAVWLASVRFSHFKLTLNLRGVLLKQSQLSTKLPRRLVGCYVQKAAMCCQEGARLQQELSEAGPSRGDSWSLRLWLSLAGLASCASCALGACRFGPGLKSWGHARSDGVSQQPAAEQGHQRLRERRALAGGAGAAAMPSEGCGELQCRTARLCPRSAVADGSAGLSAHGDAGGAEERRLLQHGHQCLREGGALGAGAVSVGHVPRTWPARPDHAQCGRVGLREGLLLAPGPRAAGAAPRPGDVQRLHHRLRRSGGVAPSAQAAEPGGRRCGQLYCSHERL